MKRSGTTVLVALVALTQLVALSAQAAPPQTVYRCGPDGRVYSQAPCTDGKPLSVEDPRSGSQQSAARDVAARDAEQARQLADQRRQRERAAQGQPAAGFKTAPPAPAAASAGQAVSQAKAARKTRAAPPADPRMSPPMRVPAAASAPR